MKDPKFAELINNIRTILIISSQPLDFDCLGSGLILKKYLESLGKKVRLIFPRKLNESEREYYSFLPCFEEIEDQDTREVLKQKNFDLLIFVDGTNLIQFYGWDKDDGIPNINIYDKRIQIDHHLQQPEEIATLVIKNSQLSSTMEVILSQVLPEDFIDEKMATLAYAALVGDTGNFRWNFTPATLEWAAKLLKKGARALEVIDRFFFFMRKDQLEGISSAIKLTEYFDDLGASFVFLPLEKLQAEGIDEHKLAIIRDAVRDFTARVVRGYPLGFVMYESKPKKISIKAYGNNFRNKVNLPKMFVGLGGNGGGHFNAAGADIEGGFEEIKHKLFDLLKNYAKTS